MAKFYGHELMLGQVNLLFAVLIVAAVLAMMRGPKGGGGAAVRARGGDQALRGHVRALARGAARGPRTPAAAAGIAAALVLPVPLYGVHGTVALHVAWWRTVTESTAPNLLNADNVSLAAMFAKWMGVGRGRRAAGHRQRHCCCVANVAAICSRCRGVPSPRKGSKRRCC